MKRKFIPFSAVFWGTIVTALLFLIFVLYCNFLSIGLPWEYIGWQTVKVSEIGRFKVPGDWIITESDRTLYLSSGGLSDEETTIYFSGTVYKLADEAYLAPESTLDRKIIRGEVIRGEGLSSSVGIALQEYYIDGVKVERYWIDFPSSDLINRLEIIAWDENLSLDLIGKIARSFWPED